MIPHLRRPSRGLWHRAPLACLLALTFAACDPGVPPGAADDGDDGMGDGVPGWLDTAGEAPPATGELPEEAALPEPIGEVITITDGQGLDLVNGALVAKASFANADLFATYNGDGLRLASGGETSVHPRPVNWFIGLDLGPTLFTGLDSVPVVYPTEEMTAALPIAVPRVGFVVATHDGGWAKGWVRGVAWDSFADGWRVDIEFLPVDS